MNNLHISKGRRPGLRYLNYLSGLKIRRNWGLPDIYVGWMDVAQSRGMPSLGDFFFCALCVKSLWFL